MRSFSLFLLLAAVLFFPSCKKNQVTQVVQPNQTIFKTLEPGNWKYDASSQTYYNEIDMPEIDEQVNQTSGVLVYITSDNIRYEALPDVLDGVSFIYRYQPGLITVESQGANGAAVLPPTAAIGLKIVLIASETE